VFDKTENVKYKKYKCRKINYQKIKKLIKEIYDSGNSNCNNHRDLSLSYVAALSKCL